ncbi:hypothetical protein ACLK2H_10440 [Escherichia coli]
MLANGPFSNEPLPELPFIGGAVGLFGYDLGRRFETLPQRALNDIAVPDIAAVGVYDWALVVDHHRQVVTLLSYGDVHARQAWLGAQQSAPTALPFALTSRWQSNMMPAVWREIPSGAGLFAQR